MGEVGDVGESEKPLDEQIYEITYCKDMQLDMGRRCELIDLL